MNSRFYRLRVPEIALLASLLSFSPPASQAEVDYENEILPIFSEKCTVCHGPDDAKGGLRLTNLDQATLETDSGGQAIVPGSPDSSTLVERIHATDPDDVMPPPDKGEPLTEKEKQALRQWIAEGADWPRHWAYEPLSQAGPPAKVSDPSWIKTPVDAYVLARLDEAKIPPSPEAGPYVLIRRLYYDLLGILPTPERAEAFARDYTGADGAEKEAVYERLVDEVLKSPHFGERWGRHWLDKARYADSDGYEKDRDRPDAWKYRDWVIDSINADLPFDQFTIQQLAGDLLPKPAEDELLATAFNRQTLTNTEGGTDKEQWRVAAVMDRAETLGTVWLGLSVSCARCHTHKYDEITQKEYYELYAYFNNGDETTTDMPESEAAMVRYRAKKKEHDLKVAAARKKLDEAKAQLNSEFEAWGAKLHQKALAAAANPPAFHPLKVAALKNETSAKFVPEGDVIQSRGPVPQKDTIRLIAETGQEILNGFKLEALKSEAFPGNGPGRAQNGNFVLSEFKVWLVAPEATFETPLEEREAIKFTHSRADFSQNRFPVENAVDGKANTGWAIGPQSGRDHHAIFSTAEPVALKGRKLFFELQNDHGDAHVLGRFRITALTGKMISLGIPENLATIVAEPPAKWTQEQRKSLLDYYATIAPATKPLASALAKVQDEAPKAPLMDIRILEERQKDRRTTHVFRRGEFKDPEEAVEPGTFASLPPVEHRDGMGDRLDLARWLVSGENPLPPRVIVNHLWANLFGEGIVSTVNDFGVRGERPTHPELLDWLAAELIRQGWSRKALIKTVALSSTYRQSSAHRPELADIDPKNTLLYRQNRFRVEAEIVRDITLAASGLLSEKVGGPSVFPPIPDGVADLNYNSAFKWKVSPGEDRYRRGMYTYFKRTAPHPTLMTFDCPDSNVTCVQRSRSNTPLAALITLNNDTFAEAAKAFATRVTTEEEAEGDADRLERAFQLALARPPEAWERDRLLSLLEESRAWYRQNPDDALKLAANVTSTEARAPTEKPGKETESAETAAWIATVRIILNLDEFITRG